ncbi:DNA recombination protein RmuC [Candidatus Nomurabacteria bacterium]|nr:DNA recombination protein RmuC [Candidatus Nomurabacteria bacterium]
MSSESLLIIFILLVLNGALLYLFWKKGSEKKDDSSVQILMNQINEVNRTLSDSQKNINESVTNQFDRSQKLIQEIDRKFNEQLKDVTQGFTSFNEKTNQIFNITEQLQNLEKTLKHQKQRGSLGEASLELILSNILPPTAYKMQYSFKNGETVDAIIMTKDGLIPVDAKFSLDNYNRIINAIDDEQKEKLEKDFRNDLKKRIDETAKYVRPEEGTLPFAFMFIPAEGIYYDLLINEVGAVKVNARNLIDYAYNDRKVIIVSPTTFAAYLQSVLYGFRAFKIEESAHEIRKYVGELQKHLKAYEEYHTKLGNTLSTTVNHYNQSNKEFGKIDKDILKISGSSMDLDLPQLEKPQSGE